MKRSQLGWLRWIALLLVAVLAGLGAKPAPRPLLKPFDARSLAEIRQANQGRPFILAFWSLHCAPCKDDIGLLTAIHARYPGVAIALVAADGPNEHPEVARYLAQQPLGRIGPWAFADDFTERIRFSVDPEWRGELPRTYLFDGDHQITAHSGLLEAAALEAWLSRVTRRRP
jgi:thiol-disulfide isomerase/thioredoxin